MSTTLCIRTLLPWIAGILLFSCDNPFGEKEKATATCAFRLSKNQKPPGSHFSFDKGYLTIESFALTATNRERRTLSFDYIVPEETTPYSLHTSDNQVEIQVKSDVYSSMHMSLRLAKVTSEFPFTFNADSSTLWTDILPSSYPLLIEGKFVDGNLQRKIILAVDSVQLLNFTATHETLTATLDKTVILDQDNRVTLTLMPQTWFADVTTGMIDSAQFVKRGQDDVIFVHRSFNSTLYKHIVERISFVGQLKVRQGLRQD